MVVPGRTRCDLRLVEDLLRLRLNAGRVGWSMGLSEVAPDLHELFDLVGLNNVIGADCETDGSTRAEPNDPYSSRTSGSPNASK